MTDKDAGNNIGPSDTKTPFERLADFAKRLLAVPHSEIEKRERAYQRRKQAKKPQRV